MLSFLLLAAASPMADTAELEKWLDEVVAGHRELPSLASVQAAAEAALELPGRDEVDSWGLRARWGALLPRLDVRVGSQRDLLVRDSLDGLDWARAGQGFGVDVAARWGLDAVVFQGREPMMHRERLRRAAARRLVRARVTELYFSRVQVLLELRDRSGPELVLRGAELDGQLLAITGGRYRRRATQ